MYDLNTDVRTVQHHLAVVAEIHRYLAPDVRLDLANAPIWRIFIADQHAGFEDRNDI